MFDDSQNAKFSSDGTFQFGLWGKAEFTPYNYETFLNYMRTFMKDVPTISQDITVNPNNPLFKSNKISVNNVGNFSIKVDQSLPESDDPIYIYVKMNQYPDIVKIELGADTGRPLIICVDAQASVGKPKVHVELNGHTFKGVIYNPYANLWEGTHINCNNSKFIGTVVCPKIEVQGGNGQFIYKDFMKNNNTDGGSGSGSGTGVSKDSPIRLVSSPEGLKWN